MVSFIATTEWHVAAFCWALRQQPATQQMSNSYFGYTLQQKKFHRARLNEF